MSPSTSSSSLSRSASAFPSSNAIDIRFQQNDLQFTLSVPSEYFSLLQSHKNAFLLGSTSTSTDEPQAPIELALAFIEFLIHQKIPDVALAAVTRALESEFLQGNDIHTLISGLAATVEQRQNLLRIYFSASARRDCEPYGSTPASRTVNSALFNEAKRGQFHIMAVFGGQGDASRSCVQELSDLQATYSPMLRGFLQVMGSHLLKLSQLQETATYYAGRPFHLESWISDPDSIPDSAFIAGSPVSVPVIGLLSLARYVVICQVLGLTPGGLRQILRATTGHSQGLLVSIVIALSDSWDSFYENSQLILEALFWLGWDCHHNAPWSRVPATAMGDQTDQSAPSYMLSVRGLKKEQMQTIIARVNKRLSEGSEVHLALINARDQLVVAGPVASLVRLQTHLRELSSSDDQSRVPFSSRKPSIQHSFLPVSTPFHTPYLRAAAESLKTRFANRPILPHQLLIPVYHTQTGQDLRKGYTDVLHVAFDAITHELCDWPTALTGAVVPSQSNFQFLSHIIVFDRGGLAPLIKKVKDGQGVRIIQGADLDSRDSTIGTMRDLVCPNLLTSSMRTQSWGYRFQPRLTTGNPFGIETRLSRLLGTPPVMVAGMTPTTKHWDFVAAIMNAGYHAELAGGGFFKASDMAAAIRQLSSSIPAWRGITCNLIYANPISMAWQVSLLRRLSQREVPIDGLTIGAGVPSPDVVAEYIQMLGIRHISFKPGSVAAIRQVVTIAKNHPDFPIILQWTGGRGGGHHSFEDFHTPILSTYGLVREQANIYLVAGSGFGTGESIYPYLTGSWSMPMGYPAMPFDGILIGSRMMVARETHTSPAVRDLICRTPGVPDSGWEKTYGGSAGGVITVQSEMGEPIHKIANRGVLFWAEMDKTVFSLPRKNRIAYLSQHRETIIRQLNDDFARPWFGRNSQGKSVDLQDMTYGEVLTRMIELMYIRSQRRWIDQSYINFTMNFATRALERFHGSKGNLKFTSAILKEDPETFLDAFLAAYREWVDDLLNPEDVSFFLLQTKRLDQKPVNFIPALNDDFEFYFKKDSLWQSEDIEAVVDQDAQRVCILHGPVAAQYSHAGNQSAKDILDGIMSTLSDFLQRDLTQDDLSPGPGSGLVTPDSWSTVSSAARDLPLDEMSTPSSVTISESTEDGSLSPLGLGSCRAVPVWVQAILSERLVLQGRERQRNPVRDFITSYPGSTVCLSADLSELSIVSEKTRSQSFMTLKSHNGIDIVVEARPEEKASALRLLYQFNPHSIPSRIVEVTDRRNERICEFYKNIWFGPQRNEMSLRDTFYGREVTLTAEVLNEMIMAVGSAFQDHRVMFPETAIVPIGMGIVIAWEAISWPLVAKGLNGDILRLVHRSNSFEYCPGATPLRLGDVVSSRSQVRAIYAEEGGKVIVVEATISRLAKPVMTVTSTFLIRGSAKSDQTTFQHIREPERTLLLSSSIDESVLRHRNWLHLHENAPPLVGRSLVFNLDTHITYAGTKIQNLAVTGTVSCQINGQQWAQIGTVNFECNECVGNPVVEFLERKGVASGRADLDTPGWSGPSTLEIQMPASNHAYAQVSKDFNPIHTSTVFASLAQLPGPICHGMCTSTIAAFALEHLVLEGERGRLRQFKATFTAMVLPLEKLVVKLRHIGMIEGRMRFSIDVLRKNNEVVLRAEAEVEQPGTAYLFTGQGSQSKGMGMDLYNASPVAKALWDDIDAQLYEAYGWSVLDIVRNNPKKLTVNFGGKRGRKIKQNYLAITAEATLPDGSRILKPVLADLTPESTSYTFTDSRGLLYSTQFAQPAILVFEAAVFGEMRTKGYVSQDAVYAGHSLGEYGALSALSRYIPIGALAELAFYRGLMMQASVDGQGSMTYGMVAANPTRVGSYFDQSALARLVDIVARESQELLEIVNFNVDGEQYVCSGTTTNLHVLGKLMDHIAQSASGLDQVRAVVESKSADGGGTELQRVIQALLAEARSLPRPIELQRGKATIPLQGIDVPFHSSHLRSTVDRFRQCLLKPGFLEGNVDVDELVGKYIPNLMAKPFSLDEAYIREAYELTQSPILGQMLGKRGGKLG
ncbi:beta subunit of fatty acid synthase [Aspergillus steynii IBT 23096]|uniref:Beta subunit of fatty acid synthase n=1 Tax=Aspergillus steynii IBT 23096 TaxID=1392250 RepID=A0A2I2GFJ4_9EURO|nr:beta subunit of fatty acid synthase [Aspergillus steynii IBT 23096]PLB51631.1 beta subunit of fatty acid synthase [Aspergillus steynii IBT 23096]